MRTWLSTMVTFHIRNNFCTTDIFKKKIIIICGLSNDFHVDYELKTKTKYLYKLMLSKIVTILFDIHKHEKVSKHEN